MLVDQKEQVVILIQRVIISFFKFTLYRCEIDWQKGQNVTVKTIKKKQKHKGRGTTRTITKTVQNDSFFNFFSPPTVPEEDGEMVRNLI